jgi:hypothetical protein
MNRYGLSDKAVLRGSMLTDGVSLNTFEKEMTV